MPTQQERLAGGLIGLLVGDALGVPYEFHAPEQIPPADQIELTPPVGFARSHPSAPAGTWSDDGAQALCLLDSLLAHNRFDADDFGRRLLLWYEKGYMAVDGNVFDVGAQTGRALRALRSGTPALQAGATEEQALGNGSLMRVLPLALWHRGTDDALVADAHAQSRVTHGHVRAQVCCALYCLWARRVIEECDDPWADAVQTLRRIYLADPDAQRELEWSVRPNDPYQARGRGYVVDTLHSAREALRAGPYEAVVRAAVAFGHDTDTTACVAGGIAGVRDGIEAIPRRWRTGLRGLGLVESLLAGLLAQ
jgi:ADP-ribosyl-[dinitrogen reductase] hydrolase